MSRCTRTLLFTALLALLAGAAWACPACNEAAGAQGAALSRGWARSIYLLMATPYLLFAGAAFCIARTARRNKQNARPQ